MNQETRLLNLTHQTLNQVQDIIIWSKPNGKLVYFNDAVITQLGYSREEFQQIQSKDFIEDYDEEGKQRFRTTVKQQKLFVGECILKRKDGTTFYAEIKTSAVTHTKESLNCTIFRNIDTRKARELERENLLTEITKLKQELENENTYLQQELKRVTQFEEIATVSKKYQKVLSKIIDVAPTNSTVLIVGETGTGKELIANAVHRSSTRKDKPFIKINCATLTENLMDSELFGHERGAFTGATNQKKGLFEIANGATLFLDEIGELPINLQAKLLRVIQEGTFYRIGGNTPLQVDVRLILATNRNLPDLIQQKNFREDLYYRINIFPIKSIPLRERKEDIPVLIKHFIKKFNREMGRSVSRIGQRTMKKLLAYDYPGNIRELENIIERAIIISKSKTLNLNGWEPTAFDQSLVQSLIINNISSLPSGPWVFFPEHIVNNNPSIFTFFYQYGFDPEVYFPYSQIQNNTYPYPSPSSVGSGNWGFHGTKVGDINGSVYLNAFQSNQIAQSRSREKEYELEQDKTIEAGEYFDIYVTVNKFKDIVGYQLGADFTTVDFELVGIEQGDLPYFTNENFGLKHIDRGEFRTLWFDRKSEARTLKNGETLFVIKAKALKQIDNLKKSIKFLDDILENEFYTQKHKTDKDLGFADVKLKLTIKQKNRQLNNILDQFRLSNSKSLHTSTLLNAPNPFHTFTNIIYHSEQQGEGLLNIQDLSGKILYSQKIGIESGRNTYEINENIPNGIMIYTIEHDRKVHKSKMIKIK